MPLRVLEIDERGMPAARKVTPYGFLTSVQPGPIYIGVEKPMKVYSFDNLFLTNAKASDDMVYKILDTLEKNKADLVAVQPVLRAFSAAGGLQAVRHAVPPRRAEVLQRAQHPAQTAGVSEAAPAASGRARAARARDRHPAGAAARLHRRLGAGHAAAPFRRLVLYRAAARRMPRHRPRAVVRRAARSRAALAGVAGRGGVARPSASTSRCATSRCRYELAMLPTEGIVGSRS